jgi:iron(III) transport system substrate-binding protein
MHFRGAPVLRIAKNKQGGTMLKRLRPILAVVPALGLAVAPAVAEQLTAADQEMLKDLKLQSSMLDGLDQELNIPQAWIDGSKKEGTVGVRLTMHPSRFEKVRKVFEARYPWIKVEFSRGIGQARALGPLLAFKRGTYVTDIVSSFEVLGAEYANANALIDLRELPAAKSPRPEFNAQDGTALAYRLQHYCVAYGAKRVNKEELPKTWEDILTNTRWHNGKTGVAINVNTWLAPLWGVKGEAWVRDYMDKLFNVVKPQIRKERLSTTPKLAALGEFDLTIPGGDFIVKGHQDDGVPVGFHCPAPAPVTAAWIGVLKGNPHPNASLIYVNWTLSKEGQLADNWGDNFLPSHKALQSREFLPFPDEILGKPEAPLTPAVLKQMPKITALWHEYWVKSGGSASDDEEGGGKKRAGPQPR